MHKLASLLIRMLTMGMLLNSPSVGIANFHNEADRSSPSNLSLPTGLHIVDTTSQSVVFEFILPDYTFVPSMSFGSKCQQIEMDGYSHGTIQGFPDIPNIGVLVGIPQLSDPSIRILSQDYVTLPGKFDICPVSGMIIDQEPGEIRASQIIVSKIDSTAYSTDRFTPQNPIELSSRSMIRDQRVVRLSVTPFQYNPSTGKLRAIKRLTVSINFGDVDLSTQLQVGPKEFAFQSLLQHTLVNYDQSQNWQSPRSQAGLEDSVVSYATNSIQPAYKIEIDKDGLYQIKYSDLKTSGLPVDTLDPRTIQLFNQQDELPVLIAGEDDRRFDPEDFILFYAKRSSTRFTDTNVYWLRWGSSNGLRMSVSTGTAIEGVPVTTSRETRRFEEDNIYINRSPSGNNNDHWYWAFMNAYSELVRKDFQVVIDHLDTASTSARVKGLLKGYFGDPRHHTRIYLNGNLVDDSFWSSEDELSFSTEIPSSILIDGVNTITVELPHDADIVYDQLSVNWFEIEYQRTLTAQAGQVDFHQALPGDWLFEASGFSSPNIQIFDITQAMAPVRINGSEIISDESVYRIRFVQRPLAPSHYLAVESSSFLSPLSINLDSPSDLKNPTNGADYMIISHPSFLSAVQKLANFRAGQGYRVKVVDVQDVYDEFNGGVFDPQAIHDFLTYAYTNWSAPAPTFVLLVGDGHYDFKDHYGGSGPNYIPPFLGEFDPWIGETASDNRYVTVSGDDPLPDMFIGRLPVNSVNETTAMVNKIIENEQSKGGGEWKSHMTFVADNADSGGDFSWYSDQIVNYYLPSGYSPERIYLDAADQISTVQKALIASINKGSVLVNFTGHASVQAWASEKLFSTESISDLNNLEIYPFLIPMTCQEGYFIYPKAIGWDYPSLAESMVRAEGKGALASFSPTGFGMAVGHDLLSQGLYHAIFRDGTMQLGPATTYAKYYLYAKSSGFKDLLDTYTLFGDPASKLQISINHNTYLPVIAQ